MWFLMLTAQMILPLPVHAGDTLWVEVLVTPEARAQGLMYRDTLPEDHGALFVFEQPQRVSFWMKNTWIPLDIAFLDTSGVVVEIQSMEPMDLTLHRSCCAVLYALEVNRGWFERHGITVGDTLPIPETLKFR